MHGRFQSEAAGLGTLKNSKSQRQVSVTVVEVDVNLMRLKYGCNSAVSPRTCGRRGTMAVAKAEADVGGKSQPQATTVVGLAV